jgi:hypothetical protein
MSAGSIAAVLAWVNEANTAPWRLTIGIRASAVDMNAPGTQDRPPQTALDHSLLARPMPACDRIVLSLVPHRERRQLYDVPHTRTLRGNHQVGVLSGAVDAAGHEKDPVHPGQRRRQRIGALEIAANDAHLARQRRGARIAR